MNWVALALDLAAGDFVYKRDFCGHVFLMQQLLLIISNYLASLA
jgi:hypothetical protein